MTFRHLLIFTTVCDEGSMTRAAAKLYMAQPSVSQAVSELEKHYGTRLFERFGRKLHITLAGQRLLAYARHIISLQHELETEMRSLCDRPTIRIGATMTIGSCLLTPLTNEFLALHSGAHVVSTVANTKTVEDLLLEDKVDIGLVEGLVKSKDLVAQAFMDDELVLICSPSHPWAKVSRVTPDQLSGERFIVREEGSGTRGLFESVMAAAGIAWENAGVYNNAEAIKTAVSSGLALSVISRMSVERERQRGELAIVNVDGITWKRQFFAVTHRNKHIFPALREFMSMCIVPACGRPQRQLQVKET